MVSRLRSLWRIELRSKSFSSSMVSDLKSRIEYDDCAHDWLPDRTGWNHRRNRDSYHRCRTPRTSVFHPRLSIINKHLSLKPTLPCPTGALSALAPLRADH